MDESPKSSEEINSEFPPLADDGSLPSPDQIESAEPAITTETETSLTVAELANVEPVAPKDPWAEEVHPVLPPEPSAKPLIVTWILLVAAVMAIVLLVIHGRRLQATVDRLQSESAKEKAQAAQLEAQLDHLSLPGSSAPGDFLIVSAVYGTGSQFKDVTDRVNALLHQRDGEFYAKPEWLREDPAPGWNKELVIVYKHGGQRHIFMTGEGGKVNVASLLDVGQK